MLQQLFHQSIWAFLLEAAVVIGVLSKIIMIIHYNRLIRETEYMSQIHTKWIKALKKRFDNYEQLKYKVDHTEIFVDKYMEMDRICGLKSRLFLRIPVVCSFVILLSIFHGEEEWIFMAGVNLIIMFLIEEFLIDERESISIIRTNLLLSIEKGKAQSRNVDIVKPIQKRTGIKEEIAVSDEKELLSEEEKETFGQIMKEWWEF